MAEQYGVIEKRFLAQKKKLVGIDEVGRGALAGPVYAGAVIIDFYKLYALATESRALVRDSKTLSRAQREKSLGFVKEIASSYATGRAEIDEIEGLGITKATFLAMQRALATLDESFDVLLIDGKYPLPDYSGEQLAIIGGDHSCFSIAAASILAKEARDEIMRFESDKFPGYGFDSHVGYATRHHLQAINDYGICSMHRKNFEPIKTLLKQTSHLPPI